MMTSFYTEEELKDLGLKSFGSNVKISRFARFYGSENISIGDNVRIDDFCILSGYITIGSHIHISAYCALYGAEGIVMEDYTGISPRSTIYSAMDDFSGSYLIGPIHSNEKINVQGGPVILRKYTQVGANCVVFPNLEIAEGAVVGAMSLVKESLQSWTINIGIPARAIRARNKGLIELL